MRFDIVALSDKGIAAVKQHIKESMKVNFMQKQVLKQIGYSQIVSCEEPFTLECNIRNKALARMLKVEDMISKVDEALELNGAKKDLDYKVEVK